MSLPELKKKIAYHPVLLGVIGLIASAALATGDLQTREAIKLAEQKDLESSLKQVLPEGYADNDLLNDIVLVNSSDAQSVKVYRARHSGEFKAAIFETSSRGYAGPIKVLLSIDKQGTVLGARVIKHAETPGLGDKIEAAKSDWILSFNGKSIGQPPIERWGVKKDSGDFDQFAGATITPRAVVKAIKEGLLFYSEHQKTIQSGAKNHE